MFLMATRNRPDLCRGLIQSMQAVGDVPEDVAVMIDDNPLRYESIDWPKGWKIHHSEEHMELTAAMNYLYRAYPDRPWYGHFSDHYRPLTKWSRPLIEAAGDWFMAWPEDNYVSWYQVSSCPVWGGKLAKEMGFLFLPTTVHLATERVWLQLWQQLNLGKCLQDVQCTHDMFETTGRPKDENRKRMFRGKPYEPADGYAYYVWLARDCPGFIERIRQAMAADGLQFDEKGWLAPIYGQTPPEFREGPPKPQRVA